MNKISYIAIVLFLLISTSVNSYAQEKIKINFSNTIEKSVINNNKKDNSGLKVTKLQYYISNITFLQNGKIVHQENNSFHLIDNANKKTHPITLDLPKETTFSHISFNLGIDSTTNVSGAFGGDLDPTKGMYWTWQNGYINFKLEGNSPFSTARKNEFIFHLGGYSYPNKSVQKVILKTNKKEELIINFDLSTFFKEIDLSKENHLMLPGKRAVQLSQTLAKCFKIN